MPALVELASRLSAVVRADDVLAALRSRPGPPIDSGLARARDAWGLSPYELDVLVAAVAPDVDDRFGRAFASCHGHPDRSRPTLGLLLDLFGIDDVARPRAIDGVLGERALRRLELIELDGAGPLLSRPLRVPADVTTRLLGFAPHPPLRVLPYAADALDGLVLSESLRSRIVELARGTRTSSPIVILQGLPGSGRHALAAATAHAFGRAALSIRTDELAATRLAVVERNARWMDAAIVVDASGGTPMPEGLTAIDLPQIWVVVRGGLERLPIANRDVHVLDVERPSTATREAIWRASLGAAAANVDLALVARRYRLGPGAIVRASAAARGWIHVSGRSTQLDTATVVSACRAMPATELDTLTQRLPAPYHLSELIVGDNTRRELAFALAWARHEPLIFDTWQMGSRMPLGRGLVCLFAGPPGTGKTMAAQILARELDLELYRVDLSRVVSKYIGETEKNLDRVFDQARAANAMLLFDEADALFGKRTEVRDAHDRYANIETGFLLQRIEVHDGVTVLATNLRKNIDEAFQRRMHVIADFPLPGVAERAKIWNQNLPPRPHRGSDVEVSLLAERFEFSGGSIRNAAVASAVFAAAGASTEVDMTAVLCAALREQQRAGRLVDASHFGPWESKVRARLAALA